MDPSPLERGKKKKKREKNKETKNTQIPLEYKAFSLYQDEANISKTDQYHCLKKLTLESIPIVSQNVYLN